VILMTIRSIIARIVYDDNLDPAEYRVIFKRQGNEYWDVPFNYLRFHGEYFQYLNHDTLYPLHRIVAIYSMDGEYLIKRRFDPTSIIIKPQTIEIMPGVPIEHQYDVFTIARLAWLILSQVEALLGTTGGLEEALAILGDYEEIDEDTYLIRKGYFAGTIIKNNTIMRGVCPLDFSLIRSYLSSQRIYLFDTQTFYFIHSKGKSIYRTTPEGTLERIHLDKILPLSSLLGDYSLVVANNKILTLINQRTKMVLSPRLARRIARNCDKSVFAEFEISRANWVYQRGKLAFIADYDTIVSQIA